MPRMRLQTVLPISAPHDQLSKELDTLWDLRYALA
jgi:hypothetical protein